MNTMDIHEIMRYLPHRFPFLLIDRVHEIQEGKSLIALKNVTVNEPFFTGHFPERPVMPGVLILEALAQASGILAYKSTKITNDDGYLCFLTGIDNARFKRVVEPGDQLRLEVEVIRAKQDLWKLNGVASVEGHVACSAEVMCIKRKIKS